MNVLNDLGAVQARIDAIAGVPDAAARPAGTRHATHFGSLVTGAMGRLVEGGARAAGVEPALALAVTQAESAFDPRATSASGAAGLMQLMPGTAHELGVTDRYDPVQNVRGGVAYLRELLERFGGDLRSAIAAYNAGPGAVVRYGGVPPYRETQAYVARVLTAYRAYDR